MPQAIPSPPTDAGSFSFNNFEGDQTILDVLLAEKILSQQQYEDIKVKSNSAGKSYEEILTASNVIPEDKIVEAKAKLVGVPYISITNTAFAPEAVNLISRGVAERFQAIPFGYDDKT